MTGESKVLLIGIDAGDIGFIRAALERLPRLRELFAASPVLDLRSPADLLTSAVWPSFASGSGPGEHGIYYPMQWDAEAMQLRRVTPDWVSYEPFWYELARRGKRVTVVDAPFSLPTTLAAGIEVQNWGSQESLGPFSCNQPELGRAILRRFGRHPMGEDVPVPASAASLDKLRARLVAGAAKKAELCHWLMQQADWDLFVTVFGEGHRGGHVLWPGDGPLASHVPKEALLEVYQAIDAAVGSLLDAVDRSNTTVIVFSVHGMRENDTQEHFLLKIMERINARSRGEATGSDDASPRRASPMRLLREAVPPQLQYAIAKAVPVGVRDWVVRRAICGGLDWNTTPGFTLVGSCEGYLRLSLVGREAQGFLERGGDRQRRYIDLVREEFMALRDETSGHKVVKEVVETATRYPGSRADLLPDLVVLWEAVPPATALISDTLGRMTGRLGTGRTGDHRPEGFAVVTGDLRALAGAPDLRACTDFARIARHVLLGTNA